MKKCKIGIIGGTGVYQLPGVEQLEKVKVETEYGDVTVNTGTLAGKRVAFLTRHGEKHSIAPSQINFRANISSWTSRKTGRPPFSTRTAPMTGRSRMST